MRVVLVRPPFIDLNDGPPIGLMYISQVLKDHGHKVSLIDLNVDIQKDHSFKVKYTRDFTMRSENSASRLMKDLDKHYNKILSFAPHCVGFSLTYSNSDFGIKLAKQVCMFVRCIVGGPQASFNEEELLSLGCFSSVVSGYGEEGVLDALSVDGIIHKKLVPSKNYTPDYIDIDIKDYKDRMSVVTTRGCPNHCTFCTQNHSYYYHSIDSVLEQLQRFSKLKLLMYNDSNINVNTKRTKELFSRISELNLQFPSHVFGMEVDRNCSEYIPEMFSSGVRELRIGVESGSRRERDSMGKPKFSNDDVIETFKVTTGNKIKTWAQFIFCYPDQTEDDRKQTLDLMLRLNRECDRKYIKILWFKFVVHHGVEKFFSDRYGVEVSSPANWKNDLYTSDKIKKIKGKYAKIVPSNARIYL